MPRFYGRERQELARLLKRWMGKASVVVLGMGTLATLYAVFIERARVQLDEYTVKIDKPGLPPEGLTILHVSDLHCRKHDRVQARKLAQFGRLLDGRQYDVLALTGDLIHDEAGFATALACVQSLRPRLAAFSCPGNHDYCESSLWGIFGLADKGALGTNRPLSAKIATAAGNFRAFFRKVWSNERVHLPIAYHNVAAMHAALERNGIHPLVNRAWHVQTGAVNLWVAGVDDLWEGHADLEAALAAVPEDALLLLLAHNPDAWLEPCAGRADLILSGHVHGGQVRLPLLGAVHTQGSHLTRHRAWGWFQRGTTRMFVSRGLGESLPLRFGVPPQVTLIHLVPAG
jgi:uncharacterized protein